jgi:hypothetical protein
MTGEKSKYRYDSDKKSMSWTRTHGGGVRKETVDAKFNGDINQRSHVTDRESK